MQIKIPTLGADIWTLPHPTVPRDGTTAITRDALAATKKEQKPHKNQAHLYKTLTQTVTLYT